MFSSSISHRIVSVATAATLSLSVAAVSMAPAAAAEQTSSATPAGQNVTAPQLTPEVLDQAQADLQREGHQPTISAQGYATYDVNGVKLTFAPHHDKSGVSTQATGGIDDNGVWIELNPTDQKAVIAGGEVALLGILCAVTGGAVCAIAGVLSPMITTYLADHGICADNKALRINGDFAGDLHGASCV